ncbi:MAG: IPT/TIG domain-containing protein, partial [Terriglobus sp.]
MKRIAALLLLLWSAALHAGNPRFVAGTQWTNAGKPMGWYRNDVQYFVDAGALSTAVNHAAAVAMVDAAAAVWNLNGLPLRLTNGGGLAEDVNADTVYIGTSGLVWPQDVASANYAAKQIAVVLDADGSVTDALLGAGASDASNCRTNAVTESVDLFVQPGKIAHAVIVVNGRCSGSAAEQQLQLKYQLMRVFGRVLGLGWSQVNDNVFIGSPAPTYLQQMHWPIMHPMDIICGPYTYQCLPQPFTLREDDVAAMWMMYADASSSYAAAGMMIVNGVMSFPGGVPMGGVNLSARRYQRWGSYGMDAFQAVATVSGYDVSMNRGNPVAGPLTDTVGVTGPVSSSRQASVNFGGIALTTGTYLHIDSESVNPLYVGAYAVGPYSVGSPALSGAGYTVDQGSFVAGANLYFGSVPKDGATECATGQDGTESAPAVLSLDGTWNGRLCGLGHTSWMRFAVKARHSATVEVTATDEAGAGSERKAMPLIGVWHASDAVGALPGIARMATAFNSARMGMTQLHVSFSATESVRLAVTDARGDGRPDYTYRARVLYADTVSPARLAATGGTLVITGVGFSAGSAVTVGGVVARVTSVSTTEIDAIAPALNSGSKDVVVTDLTTGGTTAISGAVVYSGAATDALTWTAQPAATASVGVPVPIAVRLVDVAGAPVTNGAVTLAASAGGVLFGACSLAQCSVATDATGTVQTTVTAVAAGAITLKATSGGGASAQASYTATVIARSVTMVRPTEYVAAGAAAAFTPAAMVTANGGASVAATVAWLSSSARVALASFQTVSNTVGVASVAAAGSLRDGETASVQACAWT